MKLIGAMAVVGLALSLSVSPVEAKHKNKIKTVVGCVEGSPDHYHLAAVTKKGKHRDYALVGKREFASEVGHKVQAHGTVSGTDFRVSALKDLAPRCR
ncbi:MAG TPA: hypothetical protein VFA59_10130 [Vicinamibacterales bacterium]|nr:hypothetical protein [Vicinamibacterales bacterium]